MTQAHLVQIAQAARSLGVPTDLLESKAELGAVPEAIKADTAWMIPATALARIAEREGWTLDLTGVEPRALAGTDRATTETVAAQAAVMLAKTQASAAQNESQDLLRRLRVVQQAADADRADTKRAKDDLAATERELAQLQRAKAVAEARAEELRRSLEREQNQFRFMSERVARLEQERDQLVASLGWLGRRRYRRLVASSWDPSGSTQPDQPGRLRNLVASQTLHPVPGHDRQGRYRPRDTDFIRTVERRTESTPPPPSPQSNPHFTPHVAQGAEPARPGKDRSGWMGEFDTSSRVGFDGRASSDDGDRTRPPSPTPGQDRRPPPAP